MTFSAPAAEPLPVDQSTALAEFARACKSAARSVSLYPGTHPAIAAALSRVTAAGKRLTAGGDVTVGIHPDMLVVEGRVPARPDAAIGELAALLHDRLVGELRVTREAAAEDWHALLLILSRAPEELIQDGGVAKAWTASGRTHLDIREIDYAEVLRERAGGHEAAWDRIIASCLQGESGALDDRALAALVATVSDPDRFGELLARLQASPAAAGAGMGATAAALLQLLRTAVDAAAAEGVDTERVLDTMAASMARLTPETMLGLLAARKAGSPEEAAVAAAVVDRMSDDTIASFVANSVAVDRGATERLAHAFEALVPGSEEKEQLLSLAEGKARAADLGKEATFDDLWRSAADMLTSYSDKKYVSDEYGRELSFARTRAVEVERVSDDPPQRVQQWLGTISDSALRELDVQLLLDLLRIEDDPIRWSALAAIVAAEVERRAVLGELEAVEGLASSILRERQPGGRGLLVSVAAGVADKLSTGPLLRHLVAQLRTADDRGVAAAARLCHALGAGAVRPLAEALAVEENSKAIRALREILLDFGAVGRSSVEQLKNSTNPAVRRTAIDLLRVFGGDEALPELESMLGDADQQVQRDAVRAIVQIGSDAAYAILQRALGAGDTSRDAIVQQLISLRDDKAIPLLCHVLSNTNPGGAMTAAHLHIMEALGGLKAHPQSTQALRMALHRGTWWAPSRTARLREAAATALQRIGSPETTAVLEEAVHTGSRGVRKIARAAAAAGTRRERKSA
jgi:HEAT repeat protein